MLRAHLPHWAPPRGLALANAIGAGRPFEGSFDAKTGKLEHRYLTTSWYLASEVQGARQIFTKPHLGGLHHQYVRI
jgi:hypothetical protein